MFTTNVSDHNKILSAPKRFWDNCLPGLRGLGRSVARKYSTGGLHVCAGRL